jgi:ATP-dependent helicase HrpB
MTPLPIEEALPDIRARLLNATRLVIAAPPGAGKTTRAPLALMDEPWANGKILLLEPRRIAARMAAERMARETGAALGAVIGLSTRVDRKVSRETRVEVVTDGLFTRRLIADPSLEGVCAVIFDEFHERSLAADLGLALALDAQAALRPDLRLIVMSATLDVARVSALLKADAVESAGRQYPVETIYLGKSEDRLEDQVLRAARRALDETDGSILVFLPGRAQIERARGRLEDAGLGADIAPLYGALSPGDQDAAVAPPAPGARKIILATDIAESALTIEGVDAVIDAGLARVALYDPSSGAMKLETRRAARASVDQRRGRAGRLRAGLCYRLWDEAQTRGLPAEPTPEILAADLSAFALSLAEWGERDAARLAFLDPPPAGRLAAARAALEEAGALDPLGALTARGRRMAALPLDPMQSAMIAAAASPAQARLAAEIAALVSERGLGGDSPDIRIRIERFRADRSQRARALFDAARRWAGGGNETAAPAERAGATIAAAIPSRIARRRAERGRFLTAGGRAAHLDEKDPLAGADWLVIADMVSAGASARILAAAPIDEAEALSLGRAATRESAEFDRASGRVRARRVSALGAIMLSETPLPRPSAVAARAAIIAAIREDGLAATPFGEAAAAALARIAFARAHGAKAPVLDEATLLQRLDEWLPEAGDQMPAPPPAETDRAILSLLDYDAVRAIDMIAPRFIDSAAGRSLGIDYAHEGGPMIEARAQEFYGMARHPAIARGAAPLLVSLLSPAGRQIALTRDLPAFWANGYRDMAKDMRGRYPKHDWPDDPATARPHEGRPKKRLS